MCRPEAPHFHSTTNQNGALFMHPKTVIWDLFSIWQYITFLAPTRIWMMIKWYAHFFYVIDFPMFVSNLLTTWMLFNSKKQLPKVLWLFKVCIQVIYTAWNCLNQPLLIFCFLKIFLSRAVFLTIAIVFSKSNVSNYFAKSSSLLAWFSSVLNLGMPYSSVAHFYAASYLIVPCLHSSHHGYFNSVLKKHHDIFQRDRGLFLWDIPWSITLKIMTLLPIKHNTLACTSKL